MLTTSETVESPRDSSDPTPRYADNDYDESPELVQCPAHTTERKLLTKIDLHVIPFLAIMYLLGTSLPYARHHWCKH